MKRFIILITFFLLLVRPVVASEPNNIYGIHLAQPHLEALDESAKLVNSGGGDWGYVTLVIQENDKKFDKWQEIFNRLRKLHLIPIVRLATQPSESEGGVWRRPKKEEAKDWADFLDSLNWVVKKRYIVLFNEPNHGSEWGGEVNAQDYAEVATEFARVFKEKNPDFFIMLAGFDASAPQSPPNFEDEEVFLREISNFKFQILNYIDGWSSHSYPNPGFSGSPWDIGRGTVKTYEWELGVLGRLGVNKELPVFITETGWRRQVQNSKLKTQNFLEEENVGENFRVAFEQVWLPDDRVQAVTPFVLDYQSPPFLEFSWKLPSAKASEERAFYQQYYAVQSLEKTKGKPEQIDKGKIEINLPKNLVAQSNYHLKIKLKNLGQAVWDKDDSYELKVKSEKLEEIRYLVEDLKNIMPFEEKEVIFFLKTNHQSGEASNQFILEKEGKKVLESLPWRFNVLPLPTLSFQINLFPKLNDKGDDFQIQFFDEDENLVFQKKLIAAYGGRGTLNDIQNVIVGAKYRVVVLKPYYLPRQNFIVLKKGVNQIKFKIMLPFDFDKDGKLSFNDFITLFKKPILFKLLLP